MVDFDNGYTDTAPSSEFIRVTDYEVVSIDDIKFVRELQSPISIIVGDTGLVKLQVEQLVERLNYWLKNGKLPS